MYNLGLFRTIVNGSTLFLYLFHGLLEVCAVFMPISILIEAQCTFLTPKNSMKKTCGASNFQTLPTFLYQRGSLITVALSLVLVQCTAPLACRCAPARSHTPPALVRRVTRSRATHCPACMRLAPSPWHRHSLRSRGLPTHACHRMHTQAPH